MEVRSDRDSYSWLLREFGNSCPSDAVDANKATALLGAISMGMATVLRPHNTPGLYVCETSQQDIHSFVLSRGSLPVPTFHDTSSSLVREMLTEIDTVDFFNFFYVAISYTSLQGDLVHCIKRVPTSGHKVYGFSPDIFKQSTSLIQPYVSLLKGDMATDAMTALRLLLDLIEPKEGKRNRHGMDVRRRSAVSTAAARRPDARTSRSF